MQSVWERTHATVLDNELRKAQKQYLADVVRHGRWMFTWGVVTGVIVGLWIAMLAR